MKKTLFALLLLLAMGTTQAGAKQYEGPEWVNRLLECDIIDSLYAVQPCQKETLDYDVTAYHIVYHQPLCHAEPEGEQFQLRAIWCVRDGADPTSVPTMTYIDGYEVETIWKYPYFVSKHVISEIGTHYHANLLYPEHRYFAGSAPDSCWTRVEYCHAEEAAQDLHALFEAIKTVTPGPHLITGVSKGGITTTMQHAFYPDDADIYVPNSAPFCQGLNDMRLSQYMKECAWTPELNELVNEDMKELLRDTIAIQHFSVMNDTLSEYDKRWRYYWNVFEMYFGAHASTFSKTVKEYLDNNAYMRDQIVQNCDYIGPHPQSYLNALRVNSGNFDATKVWKEYMPGEKAPQRSAAEDDDMHFSIDEEDWNNIYRIAYFYQSARELGNYGIDMRIFFTEPDEQDFADSLQAFMYEVDDIIMYHDIPLLKGVKYDEGALYDFVFQQTAQAQRPIIFLYAQDDPWTGAPIPDWCLDNEQVYCYVADEQIHGVELELMSNELSKEIYALIDPVMDPLPTAIEAVGEDKRTKNSTHKYLQRGQLMIETESGRYDAQGRYL